VQAGFLSGSMPACGRVATEIGSHQSVHDGREELKFREEFTSELVIVGRGFSRDIQGLKKFGL
jgi:hypothetical protein